MPLDKSWDGADRRRNRDDHDAIVEFGIQIANHSKAIESLASNQDSEISKLKVQIEWLYRLVWIATGVGVTLQFILKYGTGT